MTVTPTSPSAVVEPRAQIGRRRLDRHGHRHGGGRGDGGHLLLDAGELGDARDERLELEAGEDVAHRLGVHRLHLEVGDGRRAARRRVSSRLSVRLRRTSSRCSRRLPPTTPVTLSAFSSSASSEPNWPSHLTAVFSPTFGTPGQVVARLADERGDVGVLLGRHAVALDHGLRGRSA